MIGQQPLKRAHIVDLIEQPDTSLLRLGLRGGPRRHHLDQSVALAGEWIRAGIHADSVGTAGQPVHGSTGSSSGFGPGHPRRVSRAWVTIRVTIMSQDQEWMAFLLVRPGGRYKD